ncbi:unnamed protein product [Caenorhabditis bovis]|uniref:Uncharacterized protein n=1 Tax=Caenorhabditis bovis TaxID=2654633 RepID=A0A8S1EKA0_9PELO|nr:unnamed protein product [Caenorhabditis bovis]
MNIAQLVDHELNEIVSSVRGILCEYSFSSQHHRYFVRLAQHKKLVDTYNKLRPFLGLFPDWVQQAREFVEKSQKTFQTLELLHIPMHTGRTVDEEAMVQLDTDIYNMCVSFDTLVLQLCGRHANFRL